MGNLKPGATYVYEKVDGITYAREAGAAPNTRQEIGRDYDPRTKDGRPLIEEIQENKLWGEIHREAKNNPALQAAIERVKIIYYLSKQERQNVMHHPV